MVLQKNVPYKVYYEAKGKTVNVEKERPPTSTVKEAKLWH